MGNGAAFCESPTEVRDVGKKTDRHKDKPLFLRLPPAYHQALAQLSRKARRTLTSEAMIAFERYFAENGIELPPASGTSRDI